jgi:uncharacterized Zn-binding protein involved in type VI secretion
MGDRIVGQCPNHKVPNPNSGAPQPGPPMGFSAPLLQGLATTVLFGGKPVAVVGSWGVNTPPHMGLHPSDPFFAPPAQRGTVVSGSATVLIEGQPVAKTGSSCTCCTAPGQLTGTGTVLIG